MLILNREGNKVYSFFSKIEGVTKFFFSLVEFYHDFKFESNQIKIDLNKI